MRRPLERLSVWPCLETGSLSTAAAPAVNPVHPAATPSCAAHTENMSAQHHHTKASSTDTRSQFKRLLTFESRLIHGEHLGGRFTHQLHHLIWFKRDRVRWEYVWGWGCVSGPCVNVRVYLQTLMKMVLILDHSFHCILYKPHNVRKKMNLIMSAGSNGAEQNPMIMLSSVIWDVSNSFDVRTSDRLCRVTWSVTHLISHTERGRIFKFLQSWCCCVLQFSNS